MNIRGNITMPKFDEIKVCIYHYVSKPHDKTYMINDKIVKYADFKKLRHADENGCCYALAKYYNTTSNHTVFQVLTYRKYNIITGRFVKI